MNDWITNIPLSCKGCKKQVENGPLSNGLCASCWAEQSMKRALEENPLPKLTVGLTISKLIKQAHETAKEKGWWDKEPSFGELIALCHSELSEALEDYRHGCSPNRYEFECQMPEHYRDCNNVFCVSCKDYKPEGIPIELADVIIRIADLCGHYGIDLEAALKQKMEYNKSRPYRHGGKVI